MKRVFPNKTVHEQITELINEATRRDNKYYNIGLEYFMENKELRVFETNEVIYKDGIWLI